MNEKVAFGVLAQNAASEQLADRIEDFKGGELVSLGEFVRARDAVAGLQSALHDAAGDGVFKGFDFAVDSMELVQEVAGDWLNHHGFDLLLLMRHVIAYFIWKKFCFFLQAS